VTARNEYEAVNAERKTMTKSIIVLICCLFTDPLFSVCQAQQSGKVYRIGYLKMRGGSAGKLPAFLQEMQNLGYAEGKNLAIQFRRAPLGNTDRLRELAAARVKLNVDVIVASGSDAARIAKEATALIRQISPSSSRPSLN
jgi:hypothetical protein